jgi:5-methylthioadenosine/S-adenosylhomocysteine deaminase
MTDTIFAHRLLAEPGAAPAQHNVSITLANGVIASVESAPEADVLAGGGGGLLAIPGLANAHDHGRGVRYFAYGGIDQALECWVPSVYLQPDVDPYVNAALAFARDARAGISAVVNFHIVNRPEAFDEEMRAVARAANDVGIRLALVVPMRDRNPLAYGDDEDLLSLLDPDVRRHVTELWRRPALPASEQVARAGRIAQQCEGGLVHVQLGPIGVQWCSDRLLELVAEESARTGRRVHMHLLETRYQREWADANYPGGVINCLRDIGLLSPRLSVGHGVWLRDREIESLAECGVTVVLNTSSNLRLRSGIAPARRLVAAGAPIAFGLDALTLHEDNDALAELRLAYLLHNGPGLQNDVSPATLFHAAMVQGARVITGAPNHGVLSPDKAADVALLDYAAMSGDLIDGLTSELDVLLVRGASRYVRALIVAGRRVVVDGRVTGVDERELEAACIRQTGRSSGRLRDLRPVLGRYQDALKTFYAQGRHTAPSWKRPSQ